MKKIICTIVLIISAFFAKSDTIEICQGTGVNYKEFNPPGSLQSISWFWTFDGGVPYNSIEQNPNGIMYPTVGLFKTSCESTFPNGKKDTQYVYVRVISVIFDPINFHDTAVCYINLLLDPNNNYLNYHYLWTSKSGSIGFINTRTLQVTKADQYKIRIFTQCGYITDSINVSDSSMPAFKILGNSFICDNSTTLYPDISKKSGYKYEWNTTYNGFALTTYQTGTYSLNISNSFGCESLSSITVKDSCPPVLFFPNAFTPGNDDRNDLNESYLPFLRGIVSYKMTIFSRWGEKLFETYDQSIGWDGTYNSADAQLGVYFAMFELTENTGKKHIIKKTIHLLR